jgi:hypothetical protein
MGKKPTVTEVTRALEQAARVATQGSLPERAGRFVVPEIPDETDASTGDELVLYEGKDGVRVELRYGSETMWATQKQMAELFGVDTKTINQHLRHIFEEGELDREATISKSEIVQTEGARSVRRQVAIYNLDAIISVGYRVGSKQGTMFRRWATDKLVQYAIKGFVLDDERLKERGGNDYFSELRERIRDIRASEANLYAELRSICALCSDYDSKSQAARNFYMAMQNKLLWATTSATGPEIIQERARADADSMGLTHWKGRDVAKADVTIAKNYLSQVEIGDLNRLTSMVLDYFEDQTTRRRAVTMVDLETRLDEFLKFNNRPALTHLGSVSREAADIHTQAEYEKFAAARRLKRQQESETTIIKLKKAEKEISKRSRRRSA